MHGEVKRGRPTSALPLLLEQRDFALTNALNPHALMRVIDPQQVPTKDLHQYLLGAVAPRPIAFASTVDEEGRPNLAPYSFFNAFSSNPPILIFSSNRRVANNTTKDTLHNIMATREVVINVVTHDIVRQMALASVEYAAEVNEFEKSGLTPLPADLVKPFRVKESPIQMECRVSDIIPLGDKGGAGNLIVCHVLRMHIDERVLDGERIDPHKLDLMGRMGRAYYVRASGEAVQTIVQSVLDMAVGYDALPLALKQSHVLSANNLAQMASLTRLPDAAELAALRQEAEVQGLLAAADPAAALLRHAKALLDQGDGDGPDQRFRATALAFLASGH